MTSSNETVYWFDEEAADRAEQFFSRFLYHFEGGQWAGKPFELLPWQQTIIRDIFGWKRPDGTRRYRIVYIEVPRKNGKSTLAAGIALYLLFADREPGGQIYSAAADRSQAAIVFEAAKQMVEMSPALRKRSTRYRNSLVNPALAASYKALSADSKTKHGFNSHGVIFDELHAQPNRDLWDVLVTSTGARQQPLIVAITTAGWDRNSICWEQHEYAQKVLAGVIEDDAFYPVIYAADETDDWEDEDVWKKANPSLGYTVTLEHLRAEYKRAKEIPGYQNTFRRMYLNQWTQQETRWLDLGTWDTCAGEIDRAALEGKLCFGGLDLSSTTDLSALSLVFPGEDGKVRNLSYFWVPEENIYERERRDRVPYSAWAREGFIKLTPGNVVDYYQIITDIVELGLTFNIKEIAFDRWNASALVQNLQAEGFEMIAMGQGFASMAMPTRELEKMILSKQLVHDGNKVLRWNADNLVVKQDPAGNLKPDKSKSTERIDGMVALIMAIDRVTRYLDEGPSVYEERGILTF